MNFSYYPVIWTLFIIIIYLVIFKSSRNGLYISAFNCIYFSYLLIRIIGIYILDNEPDINNPFYYQPEIETLKNIIYLIGLIILISLISVFLLNRRNILKYEQQANDLNRLPSKSFLLNYYILALINFAFILSLIFLAYDVFLNGLNILIRPYNELSSGHLNSLAESVPYWLFSIPFILLNTFKNINNLYSQIGRKYLIPIYFALSLMTGSKSFIIFPLSYFLFSSYKNYYLKLLVVPTFICISIFFVINRDLPYGVINDLDLSLQNLSKVGFGNVPLIDYSIWQIMRIADNYTELNSDEILQNYWYSILPGVLNTFFEFPYIGDAVLYQMYFPSVGGISILASFIWAFGDYGGFVFIIILLYLIYVDYYLSVNFNNNFTIKIFKFILIVYLFIGYGYGFTPISKILLLFGVFIFLHKLFMHKKDLFIKI
jgi:hypothetical protein